MTVHDPHEQEVSDFEYRMRQIADQMPAIVWIVDSELTFVTSIGGGLRPLNFEIDQVVGMSLYEYFETEDPDFPPIAAHRRSLLGESSTYHSTRQGRDYWSQVEPFRDAAGKIVGCIGLCQEVQPTSLAIGSLRAYESSFQQVIDLMPHFIFVKDREGNFILANKALAERYGTTIEKLLNSNIREIHPDKRQAEQFIKEDRQVLECNQLIQFPERETVTVQGKTLIVQTTRVPFVSPLSNEQYVLAITTDNTERKQMEQALQKAHDELERKVEIRTAELTEANKKLQEEIQEHQRTKEELLAQSRTLQYTCDSITDGVAITDEEGVLRHLNPAAQRMLNQEYRPLNSKDWSEHYRLYASDGQTLCQENQLPLLRAMKGEIVKECELIFRREDPEDDLMVSVNASPIVGEQQKIYGGVAVFRDVTEQKKMEAMLRHERKVLAQLIDLQDHDRRLLAYEIHDGLVQEISGALMQLQTVDSFEDQIPEKLSGRIHQAIDLLTKSLVEARQLISGIRPPVLDELGVVAAIEYLVNETRNDVAEVELGIQSDIGTLPPALEVAIFRIAQESLNNVRHHSKASRARVTFRRVADKIRLTVQDWGIGFDPEKVASERFGLSGIRERARLLDTEAVIESAPGRGTKIEVDFPIVDMREADSE